MLSITIIMTGQMSTESDLETISRVLQLVSHLGGPEYTTDEIQWAADIPAGKRLLEWLASQTSDADQVAATNHQFKQDSDITLQTSLAPIALYSDEVELCVAS